VHDHKADLSYAVSTGNSCFRPGRPVAVDAPRDLVQQSGAHRAWPLGFHEQDDGEDVLFGAD
jgi:hypothetical protein